jgi:hypothetical protein
MTEIKHSEIVNYMGRPLIFEQISTGKKITIHFSKIKENILFGTGVNNGNKIYYQGNITNEYPDTKIYVS